MSMQMIPPNAGDVSGWQEVPVRPSPESLVELDNLAIALWPIYRVRYQSSSKMLLRVSTYNRLVKAQSTLPPGVELVVLDAYRPLAVQQLLFDQCYHQFRSEHPDESPQQLTNRTEQYVRIPSMSDRVPSPHLTGGAVDVTLRYRNGDLLDFGTEHDSMEERSWLRYFEDTENIMNENEVIIRDNRRLLYWAMASAGFGAYMAEWWHFNAPETQMGAVATGQKIATFGAIEG